jgi:hypothetical protein
MVDARMLLHAWLMHAWMMQLEPEERSDAGGNVVKGMRMDDPTYGRRWNRVARAHSSQNSRAR